MFSLDYEAVLKIMRYAMQPPIYQEKLEEITDIYGNLSFLGPYQNVTHVTKLTNKLMKTDFNARILMCRYAGVPSTLNPSNCNIFQRSLTNEGLGYSFNHANFWDIFAETPYTKLYSQIMMPKGYKEAPTPSDKEIEDENQRWIYPQKGILFPDSSGPAYGLLAILQENKQAMAISDCSSIFMNFFWLFSGGVHRMSNLYFGVKASWQQVLLPLQKENYSLGETFFSRG